MVGGPVVYGSYLEPYEEQVGLGGQWLVGDADGARDAVSEIISSVIAHADGPILGACERAEAFLARWQDDLPFGRPMAA